MLIWIAFAVGGLTGALVLHFARQARMTAGVPIPPDALVALVLDSVDAAITVYDRRGRLIRANRCAERLSGYTEAELKDWETWRRIIPPEEYAGLVAFLTQPKLADFPRPNVNPWITKSGERRLMKWSNVALDDGHGGVLMIVCIGFDITAQRQFERDLIEARNRAQEANTAKSLFLANMSHELRTPLNAIIGFSQVIRDGVVGAPEKSAEYAGDIHDSAVLLLELISDILDMSKLEANKAMVEARDVDIVHLVASCVRLVRQHAHESGIKLVQSIDTELPMLHVDERMIKQVLLNLLSNAVKFTGRTGTVVVSAKRSGAAGDMEISVADSGSGIPESEISKLFQPFHQAHSPLVQKPQGTGLGLAISKRLIELHDGRIALASIEGKGTTVTITLPASRCVPETGAAKPIAAAAAM
jgi:two-component system cell cycle sensor histidine kinase PleC